MNQRTPIPIYARVDYIGYVRPRRAWRWRTTHVIGTRIKRPWCRYLIVAEVRVARSIMCPTVIGRVWTRRGAQRAVTVLRTRERAT